jgi:hypothetical protein
MFKAVSTVMSALPTEINLSLCVINNSIDFKVISNRKKVCASNYATSSMKKYWKVMALKTEP